ncbi:HTH domain-containing protein [Deferribacter autotrophicus]|uniref:HTH domain-containing protein n=1 Tax=Deferribacter autotrophicus TaxID=500465 RepID=A0A5A8F8Z2_9BACT|nr:HTH domain-containing protein [Deferribacter autotrophicus]KAA0259451.1 HTH domain-containing protein [Deferribacter autotrophicus]
MGTVRQEIIEILTSGYFTAKELSKKLSLSEKEIVEHLKEINKGHVKIEVRNPQCKKCGFKFTNLRHFKKPSKCPSCKSTYISEPEFTVRK